MAKIVFELPDNVREHLSSIMADVGSAAKEAAVVEMYRQGQLSHGALAECLGLARDELDALLKRHRVVEDLQTVEEFDQALAQIRQ
jgi:predicted HTH domain antitoxin